MNALDLLTRLAQGLLAVSATVVSIAVFQIM